MSRTLFSSCGTTLGAVLAFLVGGTASASTSSAQALIPSFKAAPCGFKDVPSDWPAANGLTCGWVTVKAHRDRPRSQTLRLWVFKMAALNPSRSGQPPLIRMVGGPEPAGVTPTSPRSPTNPLILRLRADRDVIYFDYRGLDKSEPKLECKVAPVTGATLAMRWQSKLAQYAECRRQIEASGADLSSIRATAAAQDVEDIAKALNYREYDLWGSSYGTFPELYLVGGRPPGLRAAIVGVAFPPDTRSIEQFSTFGQGLTAMQRECDRDPACHERFSDMAGSLGRAMDRFSRETLMGHSRRLTPADLYQSLFNMSTDPDSLRFVPLAISNAEKGDPKLVAEWADMAKGDDLGLPEATDPQVTGALATVCSTVPDPRSAEDAVKAAARRYPYLTKAIEPADVLTSVCQIWQAAPPPRDLRRPIRSEIPVLFYYARLDTAVLTSDTLRVAKNLPRSTVIEVPGVGHNFSDDCLVDLYSAFLNNPNGILDRSCTKQMKPISFALSGFADYVAEISKH